MGPFSRYFEKTCVFDPDFGHFLSGRVGPIWGLMTKCTKCKNRATLGLSNHVVPTPISHHAVGTQATEVTSLSNYSQLWVPSAP